ncbi:hypothetical protein AGOR_G00126070 [Albula goreensis]|uniref:Uncharacterized protein n=1 Tax=Albula goreensis TaxID=1534307 RepID=A0A8T3DFB5_9TELE|nr:hypothetical protein AGOR_G00126070 [Albula goreensis]
MKTEMEMESTDYIGVEPRSSLNRSEATSLVLERKTIYGMNREEKDVLSSMKEEVDEEGLERQSVKFEKDGIRDEGGCWSDQEEERNEQRERDKTNPTLKTDHGEKNRIKSECEQLEGEGLSSLVTSLLLKQPRVLIHRLEITDISGSLLSPKHLVSMRRGQGGTAPVMRKRTLRHKNNLRLERPLKLLPVSSENGISAEMFGSSPIISPRTQDTGQTQEISTHVFACSQCPFVHMEEVNLHQHMEKVHPEEYSGNRAENPLSPSSSSTHQHPTSTKTLPKATQSHTGTPRAHTALERKNVETGAV